MTARRTVPRRPSLAQPRTTSHDLERPRHDLGTIFGTVSNELSCAPTLQTPLQKDWADGRPPRPGRTLHCNTLPRAWLIADISLYLLDTMVLYLRFNA